MLAQRGLRARRSGWRLSCSRQFPATAVLERILSASADEQSRFGDWRARARRTDDERLLDRERPTSALAIVAPGDREWPATARRPRHAWRRSDAGIRRAVRTLGARRGRPRQRHASSPSRSSALGQPTAYGEQVARDLAFACAGLRVDGRLGRRLRNRRGRPPRRAGARTADGRRPRAAESTAPTRPATPRCFAPSPIPVCRSARRHRAPRRPRAGSWSATD